MGTIQIPRTAKGVTDELGQIGELLTATEWKRAALLAAVVRLPGSGGDRRSTGRDQTPVAGFETAEQFAARGIKGLRKGDTVRLYVQRWLDANDGEYPELGRKVVLPEDEWPPTRTGTDGFESEAGAARTIERLIDRHGPDAVAGIVVDNEKLSTAVNREKLDRHISPSQRRDLRERARQNDEFIAGVTRDSKEKLAEHIPHEAWYAAVKAEAALKAALLKSEAYPYRSPKQQAEIADVLGRVMELVNLLLTPSELWTEDDLAFLADLSGEEK